ncbi:unnamed protein product [Tetraodon nigroviridis]|uniref:(spotted green pufferfish) hypothetical protein n=1 Tax=Tetraodon nigroviridis TaxID=99883 RepID=Q4REI1_TETNG|nr:unnamed protein product [Tetraodon nigroviridis]
MFSMLVEVLREFAAQDAGLLRLLWRPLSSGQVFTLSLRLKIRSRTWNASGGSTIVMAKLFPKHLVSLGGSRVRNNVKSWR